MDKKKLYFYGPNDLIPERMGDGQILFFNTVPLHLNAHLKRVDPELHKSIEWTRLRILGKSQEELVNDLNKLSIDILCVSLYLWNVDSVLDVLKDIKRHINKDIVIIAGGPSVEIYRNRKFLHENPDIDFAIYTQGEHAFVNVLEHIQRGKKLNSLNTKNLAWLDENKKLQISAFEFVRDTDGSPYLESKELLIRMKMDSAHKNVRMVLPYETSRGCPYKCTFCDWTSGLTHKVSKREFDFEQELDFLGRAGIVSLQMSDANFGIHKRDIEIARIMAKLRKERGYNFTIFGNNFNKLKKDVVFEIMDIMLDAGILLSPKFAIQDVDLQVLKDIDRPDIPWSEHKQMIQILQNKYPNALMRLEIILGLPGQTVDSWENTLLETMPFALEVYPLMVLPNSPLGYDLDYRKRMKIGTHFTNMFNRVPGGYKVEIVTETYSYNFDDYAYFTLLAFALRMGALARIEYRRELFEKIKTHDDFSTTIKSIKDALINGACEQIGPIVMTFMQKFTHKELEYDYDY